MVLVPKVIEVKAPGSAIHIMRKHFIRVRRVRVAENYWL